MRFHGRNRREKRTHFFSLPNEIFLLGLAHGELAVYCYLKYLENRKTHQCWPSYRNIGKAVGMSENTVHKYVAMLEERGLIELGRSTGRLQITVRHLERKVDLEDSCILRRLREASVGDSTLL